ncbi:MAG TPA: carboxypeptidase regulatory-like domain-containing protein, partial [Bryobacteraceae bacterium]
MKLHSKRGRFLPPLTTLLLFIILSSIGIPTLMAQTSSAGAVSGVVLDQQGAAIQGVDVRIIDPRTNTTLSTVTNDAGRFVFPAVPPATYNVTFTKPGFTTRKVSKQQVSIGGDLTLNATLEVGSVSNVVEVTASPGAELQTVNASVGSAVSGASLTLLPLFGSDVSSLANLQPGVSPEGATAGAMYDQNVFQLDGGNNSNDMDGSMRDYTGSFSKSAFGGMAGAAAAGPPSGVVPTPPDTIEEIKVSTSGTTADFNGASGSQIQVVTKRGTNDFHGSAYYYYNSSNVAGANSWDNNHTLLPDGSATPIPISHNQHYGFTIGGPILPKMLGGKTYFFFGLEGFNFNNSALINRQVPTATLRAGVIQINEGGTYVPYNVNPFPVTVGGTTYQPAACGTISCDPRGIGLNSQVSQIWNKFMPLPNNTNLGDGNNVEGFQGQALLPERTKAIVGRIDHDFGDKWRLFSTYRYYGLTQLTTNQIDIGGALPGDKFGVPAARAPRPQKPELFVVGLSTTISPTMTNDFHWNFTKIWWQWASSAAPPQLPGLGGALEIGGETANALIPYNVNNQSVRQRFWDGHDTLWKDDVTKISSNHV